MVNGTIVKGKYKYAEGTPVRTHKVRLVNDCHLFRNSVSRATVRIQTDDIHPVVVQARKNGPYLVPNTLLMPGDVSLYIMNDSDSYIQLKYSMVVAVRQEALHIEEVSESDRRLTKWNGQSVINQSNGSLHLDDIIGAEEEDNPLLTGNSGTISRVEKDEDIQELKSKSGQLDSNTFRDVLIVCLPDHMKYMFQHIGEDLSNDQLLRVYLLLISRDMVFSKGDTDPGTFTAVKHQIDTGNSRPIKQRMRRTPLGYDNEEQEHLEKPLKAGVIKPSCSEWASTSVLVGKRDGSVRWCIDLPKLNDVTVKDCYTLPLLQDCIDALEVCRYFTTLDMTSGYYQLEVAEEDRDKTAFVTKYGLFSFRIMPFTLCNAPATFSRSISLVLSGLSWKSVIAFLDVVLGRDFDNHMVNLSNVLRRFEQYGMKLKPKKCQLLQDSVVFLGRLVSREGMQVPPGEITRIGNWGVPLCKRDDQSFTGVLNFYMDHIPKFALVAKPLYDIMGPSSTFSWGTEQEKAFDALRQKLMEAPVLADPYSEDLFTLDTDAANHAIGAELLQVQNVVDRLIGFGSFVLDSAQRNYCTTRKELLAVVRFTRHFQHYLLGRRFTLRTDHNSLLWLMWFKNIEGQLVRWIEELAVNNMEIVH